MRQAPATTSDNYEAIQGWNAITTWLHSFRYKHALDAMKLFADRPTSVLEIGSATGKLFGLLDAQQPINYTGIEPYAHFAHLSRERFGDRPNFRVIEATALPAFEQVEKPDVVIALETLEHIEQPECERVVERVAQMRPARFIVSVPVEVGTAIIAKNLGSLLCGYGRHREYGLAGTLNAAFYRMDALPVHGTSHVGFDWRWLAQTLRYHFRITEVRKFPFAFLPVSCNATVFMICEPRAHQSSE